MTVHLPEDLTNSIRAEVLSGHFASEDDMIAAAVRDYLRRKPGGRTRQTKTTAMTDSSALSAEETNTHALQHHLYESGVLSEIKPPLTDLTPYHHRQAIPIQGTPLSETILHDRR